MKRIALHFVFALAGVSLAAGSIGCQSGPGPNSSAAEVKVIAKPKAGVKETFARVPVYDAAPKRQATSGAYERVDYFRLSDIIVWLEPATKPNASAPARGLSEVVLEIDPETSDPTIHPLSVGQALVLRNRSSRPISPYSVSDGNEFELPPIAPNTSRAYVVRAEGPIEVLVDPAKPPAALVYAAPSPWVARARSGQTVKFQDVLPGSYRATSWHPRLPSSTADIDLRSGEVSRATLTVGVDSMAEAPALR